MNYFVSAAGSDSNNGTSTSTPWRTLSKVNAVAFSPDDTISFRGGDIFYGLLSNSSSGTSGHPITYNSYGTGHATLSGGISVSGWSLYDASKNIWKASFSAATGRPRNLWLNGIRCTRAKTSSGLPSGITLSSGVFNTSASSSPGYLDGYGNPSDIEFVFRKEWKEKRMPVSGVSGNSITMLASAWPNLIVDYTALSWDPSVVSWVENAYEILSANALPSTFYHDRTGGYLYLIPPLGFPDPRTSLVIAPVRENVVSLSSNYVTITGVIISHTTTLQPSGAEGFSEFQANTSITGGSFPSNDAARVPPAALVASSCIGVTLILNIFQAIGCAAICINGTSTSCEIAGNVLGDISGNGIMVGDPANYNSGNPSSINIHSNLIRYCGVEFHGAVGIINWYANASSISYNEIHDLPYTGISCGWGWGREIPNANLNNVISFNKILDCVQVMNDGGAIYSNSENDNESIASNWVYGIGGVGATTVGLYLDDGSKNVTANNNVLHQIGGSFLIHCNNNIGDNTITNTTCDSGSINVQTGPLSTDPNNYQAPNAVGLSSAQAAGAALGAGIESGYSSILSYDDPETFSYFFDTLNSPDGTNLSAHTSDSGNTWALDTGFGNSLVIKSQEITSVGGGTQYVTNWSNGSNDYWFQGTIVMPTSNNCGVFLALRDTSGQCYLAGYQGDSTNKRWIIYRENGGSAGYVVTGPDFTLNSGQSYFVQVFVVGSLIRIVVDGTEVLSGVDSALTSGTIGIQKNNPPSGPQAPNIGMLAANVISYSISGPGSGHTGSPSSQFTLNLVSGAVFDGTRTVTMTASSGTLNVTVTGSTSGNGSGTVVVTPNSGQSSFTFTFTPSGAGVASITPSNEQAWQNPTTIYYMASSSSSRIRGGMFNRLGLGLLFPSSVNAAVALFYYLRPDGASKYNRPDGTSFYFIP